MYIVHILYIGGFPTYSLQCRVCIHLTYTIGNTFGNTLEIYLEIHFKILFEIHLNIHLEINLEINLEIHWEIHLNKHWEINSKKGLVSSFHLVRPILCIILMHSNDLALGKEKTNTRKCPNSTNHHISCICDWQKPDKFLGTLRRLLCLSDFN